MLFEHNFPAQYEYNGYYRTTRVQWVLSDNISTKENLKNIIVTNQQQRELT